MLFVLFLFASFANASLLESHRDLWRARIVRIDRQLEQVPILLQKEQTTLAEKRERFAQLNCRSYLSEFVEPLNIATCPLFISTMDEQNCLERIRAVGFPFIWDLLDISARRHVCDNLAFSISKTVRKISTRVKSASTLVRVKQMYSELIAELDTVMTDDRKLLQYEEIFVKNQNSVFYRLIQTASMYEHYASSTDEIISLITDFRLNGFSVVSETSVWENEATSALAITNAFDDIFNQQKPPEYIVYVLAKLCGNRVDSLPVRTRVEHLAHRVLGQYKKKSQQFADILLNTEREMLGY